MKDKDTRYSNMEITLLRKSIRAVEREFGRHMRMDSGCCGITVGQCHILMELDTSEPLSLKALERRLGIDKAALSRTIQDMVEADLTRRVSDPDDRRSVLISLSEAGEKKASGINQLYNGYYRALLSAIPKENRNTAVEGISLIAGAMEYMRISGDTQCRI